MQRRDHLFVTTAGMLAFFLLSGFGLPFRHKKYERPITKETLQPDKVLFDRGIKDIEHGDYEAARLTLNTLINTYDTSEYLAKAQLAIADSWFREGGAHGLAQAEQGYKDFILFFPNMEEAAESQFKICNIHYKQMEKADRDSAQGQRAEDECRQVMVQFPNSKFVPQAQQMLRNTQEVLADKEFRTGDFYHHRGSFPAAANRLSYVTQQYPLYSGADEALWELADAYKHMGDRFENQEADALTKIVHEYPLSEHVDEAKELLTEMKRPVPEADPVAYAHMKYELENRHRPGLFHRAMGPFMSHPDTYLAAKSGTPAMKSIVPPTPVSVPRPAGGGQNGISDVTAGVVQDTDAIDRQKDARLGQPGAPADATSALSGTGEQKAGTAQPVPATPAANQPLPTNHPPTKAQLKAYRKAQEKAAKQAKKNAAARAKETSEKAKAAGENATPAAASTTPESATAASTSQPGTSQQ